MWEDVRQIGRVEHEASQNTPVCYSKCLSIESLNQITSTSVKRPKYFVLKKSHKDARLNFVKNYIHIKEECTPN
jgi:hypothetical protein